MKTTPRDELPELLTDERLRGVLSSVPLILLVVDTRGVITAAEGRDVRYVSAHPAELVGRTIDDGLDRFAELGELFGRALGGERFETVVEDLRCSYEMHFAPLRAEGGPVVGAVGLATDVTHRRSAERALAYRLAAEEVVADISTSFINLSVGDPGGLVELAIRTLGNFAEVDRCSLIQLSDDETRLDCTHEWCAAGVDSVARRRRDLPVTAVPWMMARLREQQLLHVQRVTELGAEAEAEQRHWQGLSIRSLLLVAIIYGGGLRGYLAYDVVRGDRFWSDDELRLQRTVANVFVNGLARVRIEESIHTLNEQLEAQVAKRTAALRHANVALQDSEAKYRHLYEATSDAVLLIEDPTIIDCNEAALRMLGCDRQADALGKPLGRFFPPTQPDGRSSVVVAAEHADEARRRGNTRFDWWFQRPDGREFPAEVVLETIDWGEVEVLQVVVRDITQRKGEEEALRISEQRFRSLIERGSDLITVLDRDGTIRYESSSIQRTLGHAQAALIGQRFADYVHPNDQEEVARAFGNWELDLQPDEVVTVEARFRHRDGSWRMLEMVGQNQLDEPMVEGLVVNSRDITERKRVEAEMVRAQAQMLESEKMAALGGLVAGVAHEINTPLGVGVTAASYLVRKTEEYRGRYRDATLTRKDFESFMKAAVDSSEMILSNLRRAADLIQSFQQVAVDQSNDAPRQFRVSDYLGEVLLSMRPKLKKGRHKVFVSCPEELEILAHPGAFSQVLTNLIMNSMLHGFEDRSEGEIKIDVTARGRELELRYSDDGRGIESGHLRKIYEPFFSTKRGQGGSGLGLHIVYNLVTQTLDGQIDCRSQVGHGTEFLIQIPWRLESFDD